MKELEIISENKETIRASFDRIAERLFTGFQLEVNRNYYRLLDIEFYYFAPGVHEDVYAHQHEAQLQAGKWYFHPSGVDITFGNGRRYGGILIRALAKMAGRESPEKYFIEKEVHGPLNVKTELCSRLHGPFEYQANTVQLHDVSREPMPSGIKHPSYIVKTGRIGLNPDREGGEQEFFSASYRYVNFFSRYPLKLRERTVITGDAQMQIPAGDVYWRI